MENNLLLSTYLQKHTPFNYLFPFITPILSRKTNVSYAGYNALYRHASTFIFSLQLFSPSRGQHLINQVQAPDISADITQRLPRTMSGVPLRGDTVEEAITGVPALTLSP